MPEWLAIAAIIAIVKTGRDHGVVRPALGDGVRKADGTLGQGGGVLYGDYPCGGAEVYRLLFCYPAVVERSVVAGIRIFRQYLEQYQEYSRTGLERHQADSGRCGECAEAGCPEHLLRAFPVHFTDLEHTKDTASNIWNGIKTTVVNIAIGLKDAAVNAFKNLVSGIRSALSGLASVVQNGFSGAISFITSLPGKALQWGKDFIQGLINGIKSMVQAVVDTVSGIASRIASLLHFSAPDEGPLSDYEKWMPDFMKGLAGGIEKEPQPGGESGKGCSFGYGDYSESRCVRIWRHRWNDGWRQYGGYDLWNNPAVSEALSGFSSPQGNIVIPVYVGGTLLDELVVTAQARQNLRSGGR